jgi:rare lipoprotein A (peptidoglycan hydrolase)
MTIAARESALLRNALWVQGNLPSADAGRTVEIELSGARTGWTWQTAAQTQVRSNGSYSAAWNPNRAGRYAIRAVVQQSGASAASGPPTITVTVYRPAVATLYGPGFYGHHTACGTILRRRTVGVANRTLPCGTPVAVYYGGKMMIVPVIDRGPYANGANWDLTLATGKALGMNTTASIGAVPLPRR